MEINNQAINLKNLSAKISNLGKTFKMDKNSIKKFWENQGKNAP